MTKRIAHKHRRRPPFFRPAPLRARAGGWSEARHRKVTLRTLNQWLETGFVQPVIYRGRMCGIRRKPDDSALFRLLRRQSGFVDPYWSEAAE